MAQHFLPRRLLDDLEIGMMVEVAILFLGEADFEMVELYIWGDDDEGEFEYILGEITDLGDGEIAIDGEPFPVSNDVFVILDDDTEGHFGDLEVGMLVEIGLVFLVDDGLLVVEIYVIGDEFDEE